MTTTMPRKIASKLLASIRAVRAALSDKRKRQRINDEIQFVQFARYIKGKHARYGSLSTQGPEKVVMIDGNDHEIIWAIRWSVLLLPLIREGYHPVVLTRKTSAMQNKYYKLFGCRHFLFIDDFFVKKELSKELLSEIDRVFGAEDVGSALLEYKHKGIPVGKITLSGYSRYQLRGHVDFSSSDEIEGIKTLLRKNLVFAHFVDEFLMHVPKVYITSEAFHDDHGVFYYHMLNKGVNIIKMNLSAMDNSIVMQRRNQTNDGVHHNTVTRKTLNRIKADKTIELEPVKQFVEQNFADRYSEKWHLSKRNFRNTALVDRQHIIKEYDLNPKHRIATIFSHILYDTLYFFEEELYPNYTEWLIDTIRAAIENKRINWLIKLHPSNAWRGEFNSMDQYEEVRVIKNEFKSLPDHIKLVYPSTTVNPLSWIKHSDFGITARGTIGMEMPCFGNHVVTAASGRYADLGFTIDPKSKDEYKKILLNLQDMPPMTEAQINRAMYFYYTIFALKPMNLTMLKPTIRKGFDEVRLFGSFYSMPTNAINLNAKKFPPELESFAKWVETSECVDYVYNWEAYCV